jgi:protein TonB
LPPLSSTSLPGIHFLRPAFSPPASYVGHRPSPRRRAVSLALAVAITLAMILGLLFLSGTASLPSRFRGGPVMLDLGPDADDAAPPPRHVVQKTQAVAKRPPSQTPPVPVVKLPPVSTAPLTPIIELTREENESVSTTMHRVAAAGGGNQLASGAGDSRTVGTAPDGAPLYDAQWYRRPTNAELSTYLPAHMPIEGWGLIACRTVAHYHVDDCVELGSSPPGSHLAGAVRQAAWQFLVRPPRLGGRDLVGTWVRIRIDYSPKAQDQSAPDAP